MNKNKYLPRIFKRDRVSPADVRYCCQINEQEPKDFSTKLEMVRYIAEYRSKFNEIHNLSLYRINYYNLLEKY